MLYTPSGTTQFQEDTTTIAGIRKALLDRRSSLVSLTQRFIDLNVNDSSETIQGLENERLLIVAELVAMSKTLENEKQSRQDLETRLVSARDRHEATVAWMQDTLRRSSATIREMSTEAQNQLLKLSTSQKEKESLQKQITRSERSNKACRDTLAESHRKHTSSTRGLLEQRARDLRALAALNKSLAAIKRNNTKDAEASARAARECDEVKKKLSAELTELASTISTLTLDSTDCAARVKSLEDTVADQSGRLRAAAADRESLTERLSQTQKARDRLEERNREIAAAHAAEQEALVQAIGDLESKAQGMIAKLKRDESDASRSLRDKSREVDQLRQQLTETRETIRRNQILLVQKEQRHIDELAAATEARDAMAVRLAEMEDEMQCARRDEDDKEEDAEERIAAITSERDEALSQLDAATALLASKTQTLGDLLATERNTIEKMRLQMDREKKQALSALQDLASTSEKDRGALQAQIDRFEAANASCREALAESQRKHTVSTDSMIAQREKDLASLAALETELETIKRSSTRAALASARDAEEFEKTKRELSAEIDELGATIGSLRLDSSDCADRVQSLEDTVADQTERYREAVLLWTVDKDTLEQRLSEARNARDSLQEEKLQTAAAHAAEQSALLETVGDLESRASVLAAKLDAAESDATQVLGERTEERDMLRQELADTRETIVRDKILLVQREKAHVDQLSASNRARDILTERLAQMEKAMQCSRKDGEEADAVLVAITAERDAAVTQLEAATALFATQSQALEGLVSAEKVAIEKLKVQIEQQKDRALLASSENESVISALRESIRVSSAENKTSENARALLQAEVEALRDSSVLARVESDETLDRLRKQITGLEEQIQEQQDRLDATANDSVTLRKIAREKTREAKRLEESAQALREELFDLRERANETLSEMRGEENRQNAILVMLHEQLAEAEVANKKCALNAEASKARISELSGQLEDAKTAAEREEEANTRNLSSARREAKEGLQRARQCEMRAAELESLLAETQSQVALLERNVEQRDQTIRDQNPAQARADLKQARDELKSTEKSLEYWMNQYQTQTTENVALYRDLALKSDVSMAEIKISRARLRGTDAFTREVQTALTVLDSLEESIIASRGGDVGEDEDDRISSIRSALMSAENFNTRFAERHLRHINKPSRDARLVDILKTRVQTLEQKNRDLSETADKQEQEVDSLQEALEDMKEECTKNLRLICANPDMCQTLNLVEDDDDDDIDEFDISDDDDDDDDDDEDDQDI